MILVRFSCTTITNILTFRNVERDGVPSLKSRVLEVPIQYLQHTNKTPATKRAVLKIHICP